jgi:hypothetical protein
LKTGSAERMRIGHSDSMSISIVYDGAIPDSNWVDKAVQA